MLDALRGYRNGDGGFGHALEPDLRGPGSQPAPTLHALEILGEAGAANGTLAREARGWIASIAEPDGGVPSVLPGFEDYPHAPWFQPEPGSVLTLALAGALHAGGVRDDAWLDRATRWCWRSIETDRGARRVLAEVRLRVPRRRSRRSAGSLGDRVAEHACRHHRGCPRRRRRGRDAAPA